MPSKKAQRRRARARKIEGANKAKQAAAPSARAPSAFVSKKSPCRHFTQPEDCTRHDFELCKKLVTAFDEMCNSAMDARDGMLFVPDLYQAIISTCAKYNGSIHGNEMREALFRGMILSLGTERVRHVYQPFFTTPMPYVYLLFHLESAGKDGIAFHEGSFSEANLVVHDIMICHRNMVRFFHRRNSCDCLKDIYYELKESTKRTALCMYCNAVTEIKTMCECSRCKLLRYCSSECALAHWPYHKEECESIDECRRKKEETSTTIIPQLLEEEDWSMTHNFTEEELSQMIANTKHLSHHAYEKKEDESLPK